MLRPEKVRGTTRCTRGHHGTEVVVVEETPAAERTAVAGGIADTTGIGTIPVDMASRMPLKNAEIITTNPIEVNKTAVIIRTIKSPLLLYPGVGNPGEAEEEVVVADEVGLAGARGERQPDGLQLLLATTRTTQNRRFASYARKTLSIFLSASATIPEGDCPINPALADRCNRTLYSLARLA